LLRPAQRVPLAVPVVAQQALVQLAQARALRVPVLQVLVQRVQALAQLRQVLVQLQAARRLSVQESLASVLLRSQE